MKTIKVNCYNKATKDMVNRQNRDCKGRFSKSRFWLYLCIIIFILSAIYVGANWRKTEYISVPVDKVIVKDTASEIIEKEKNDILDTLELCESSGDANSINWDDNGVGKNRASFGAYMFKVGTIQTFKKDLTDFQAIMLASDKAQSRELARYIIFETNGGIHNWTNCMNKYGLFERVSFIKQLENKIK
jgi:hypothetical protein